MNVLTLCFSSLATKRKTKVTTLGWSLRVYFLAESSAGLFRHRIRPMNLCNSALVIYSLCLFEAVCHAM